MDQNGKILWINEFAIAQKGEDTSAQDLAIDKEGNIFVSGEFIIFTGKKSGVIRYHNSFIIKINSLGKEIWRRKVKIDSYTLDPGRLVVDNIGSAYLASDNPWGATGVNLKKIGPKGEKVWESFSLKTRIFFWILLLFTWNMIAGIKNKKPQEKS